MRISLRTYRRAFTLIELLVVNGTGDSPDYNPPVWPAWMAGMKDFAMVVD
jgi:hypothetical protein